MSAKHKTKSSKSVRPSRSSLPPATIDSVATVVSAAAPVSEARLVAAVELGGSSLASSSSEHETTQVNARPIDGVATQAKPKSSDSMTDEAKAKPGQMLTSDDRHRLTAELAYLRAVELGFGCTNPLEDWVWAEAEVERRYGPAAHAA